MRSESSRYFRAAPRVAAATSASRRVAPIVSRARAQSSVSATPGGLMSSPRAAQPLHERDDLLGERRRHLGQARAHDLELARQAGVVDPVVEAAALEGVVQLAGAVGGEHDERRCRGAHGAELRDRHLPRREHLEQERLELVVGPVDLVDEEHARGRAEGLEDRPRQQEALVEQLRLELAGVASLGAAGRLGEGFDRAQVQDLAREVPVVERLGGVDALVALEPDQPESERLRQSLGERRLAGAGLALEQDRPVQPAREEGHGRERIVGEVARAAECGRDVVGTAEHVIHALSIADERAPRKRHRAPCRQRGRSRSPGVSTSWPVARSPHSTRSCAVAR